MPEYNVDIKKRIFKEFVADVNSAYEKLYSFRTNGLPLFFDKPDYLTFDEDERCKFLSIDNGRIWACMSDGLLGGLIDPRE